VHTFATPGKTRVVIVNPCDLVDLTTDGGDTTSVELLARGTDGESLADETTVTNAEGDGTNVVTVMLPSPRSIRRRSGLDVRISAPAGVDVVVTTNGSENTLLSLARGSQGDIRLHGTVGDVDIALPRGDVSAQTVNGSLTVKTASGDLSADVVNGTVKVRSVSGDVSINEVNDDASLAVVSGDVSLATAKRSVDVTSVSGDVLLVDAHSGASCKSTSGDVIVRRAWSGNVRVATVSGDLTVGVPPGRGVSVEARSMSGELSSEIDLDEGAGPTSGDAPVVKITAHSVSGDVSIQRAAATSA
jgi:DUF4097 and DUF4098 domain-containing protein YvlB